MRENYDLPFVSVLIVTRNEKNYIENAINSILNQTYPKDKYELIIIDGLSTDGTRDLINKIICKNTDIKIQMVDNEKLILASGWNIGIKHSKGDYITRIDAHAYAQSDFIEKSVETIVAHSDVVCVGGRLRTESLNPQSAIISKVLSSPFGVGNSSFRVSSTEGYADTAVYGLYKAEVFKKVGLFDERFIRNQDIEFHSRIKVLGGKFYFNPAIRSIYYSRSSVRKMSKQAYENGKWNMILMKKNHEGLSLRHIVPFGFVLFIISTSLLGSVFHLLWWVELFTMVLYFILGFLAACKKTFNIVEIFYMLLLFLFLHISYGVGFFSGIFKSL